MSMAGTDEAQKVRTSSGPTTEWLELNDAEGTLKDLEDLASASTPSISPRLEAFLAHVARTGNPIYSWDLLRPLIKAKVETVIEEFVQFSPSEEVPPYPNVEPFKFEPLRQFLVERVNLHQSRGPPFTIQRICELLTEPMKHHKRIDKFMRALEKNFLVVSSGTCFGKPVVYEPTMNGEVEDQSRKSTEPSETTNEVEDTKTEPAVDEDEEKIIVDVDTPAAEPETVETTVAVPEESPTAEPESESSESEPFEEPEAKKRKLEHSSDDSTPSGGESEAVSAESVSEVVENAVDAEQPSATVTEEEPMDVGEGAVPVLVEEDVQDVRMEQVEEVPTALTAPEHPEEPSEPLQASAEVAAADVAETSAVEESMEVEAQPPVDADVSEKVSEDNPEPVTEASEDSGPTETSEIAPIISEEAVTSSNEVETESDAKDDLSITEQKKSSVDSESNDVNGPVENLEKGETSKLPLLNGSPGCNGNEPHEQTENTLESLQSPSKSSEKLEEIPSKSPVLPVANS